MVELHPTNSPLPNLVTELSGAALSLTSVKQIARLRDFTQLRVLCLHGNALTNLDGLAGVSLYRLTSLDVSSNRVQALSHLHELGSLRRLDVSCNALTTLDGLAGLYALETLIADFNAITNYEWNTEFIGFKDDGQEQYKWVIE